MRETQHARIRSQQRGFPPFVDRLLDDFGAEQRSGTGVVRLFFNHESVRKMERAYGRQPVALFRRYLKAYRIENDEGVMITRGWRTKRAKVR